MSYKRIVTKIIVPFKSDCDVFYAKEVANRRPKNSDDVYGGVKLFVVPLFRTEISLILMQNYVISICELFHKY